MKTSKPDIETARLLLRQPSLNDLEELCFIRSDPEVMRFITGAPASREQALAGLDKHLSRWSQFGFGHWMLSFHDDPELVGWCGLDFLDTTTEIEVGYGLAKNYWGLGIASEAAAASLRYGFEQLRLEEIVAVAYPQNTASRHVMEKLGMKYLKNGFYYGADMVYYRITQPEFQPSASRYVLRDNHGSC